MEEAISTAPEAVLEYTEQLLAVMQHKAESRGGVAVLGESSMFAAGPPKQTHT